MVSAATFLFRFSIFIAFLLLIDWYVFKGLKSAIQAIQSNNIKKIIYWLYWILTLSFYAFTYYIILSFDRSAGPTKIFGYLAGVLILMLIPKLVFSVLLFLEDIIRVLGATLLWAKHTFISHNHLEKTNYFASRRAFISQLGLIIASIPFFAILYGILKGKYNYKIHKANIKYKDLPVEFDGLTITQISDIHAGSLDDYKKVEYGIELINAQNSDLVFFTGDLVNNMAKEMEPWINLFSKIKAPMGKYSILGNHDYGDYIEWNSAEEKEKNLKNLEAIHGQIGFQLLKNENTFIEKNGAKIALLGLENWGTGGFIKKGDLTKTLSGVKQEDFKILLSHDPSHWDAEVLAHKQHIHLTLAGHTHGMQFGIEIPGIKWSPVKYRYPRWAGLYDNNKEKYIYVNRGFGFLGFPGRVGIWPEITVITLQKA